MSIDFSTERWEQTKRNYRAWWAGKLKRPLINMTVGGYEPEIRLAVPFHPA